MFCLKIQQSSVFVFFVFEFVYYFFPCSGEIEVSLFECSTGADPTTVSDFLHQGNFLV